MNSTTTHTHYDRLAAAFDSLWFYSDAFVSFITQEIIARLALQSTDRLVDLACGTGIYAKQIARAICPNQPIRCVDLSEAMLAKVPNEPALECFRMDALAFSAQPIQFDKVLMKDMIHHVEDRQALFRNLSLRLTAGGRVLILLLPPTIEYPLFAEALRLFEKRQPHYKTIAAELENAGFAVTVDSIAYPLAIPREMYIAMVAQRYMSILSAFDDRELAMGIATLNDAYRDQPILRFTDRFMCITGDQCNVSWRPS